MIDMKRPKNEEHKFYQDQCRREQEHRKEESIREKKYQKEKFRREKERRERQEKVEEKDEEHQFYQNQCRREEEHRKDESIREKKYQKEKFRREKEYQEEKVHREKESQERESKVPREKKRQERQRQEHSRQEKERQSRFDTRNMWFVIKSWFKPESMWGGMILMFVLFYLVFLAGESFRNNSEVWIVLWMLSPFVAWISKFSAIRYLLEIRSWRIVNVVMITITCSVSLYSWLDPRYLNDFIKGSFDGDNSLFTYILEILVPLFTWIFMSEVIQNDDKERFDFKKYEYVEEKEEKVRRKKERQDRFNFKPYIWLVILSLVLVVITAGTNFGYATGIVVGDVVRDGLIFTLITWVIMTKVMKRDSWEWYDWLNALAYTTIIAKVLYNLIS